MDNVSLKPRLYMFDNLKFLLITLVVLGHTLTSEVIDNVYLRSVFLFIYSFHMPLFLFISGLFQKKESDSINRKKVVTYIVLGLIIKMFVMFADGMLFSGEPKFSLLNGDGLFWYLFVLAYYHVICYCFRKVDARLILIISTLLSLFIGYDNSIGDFLCLSRAIVFFPFYYIGFCLKPNQVFLTNKYKAQARFFKENELREILNDLTDLDYNFKSGKIDAQIGLETILCKYCSAN